MLSVRGAGVGEVQSSQQPPSTRPPHQNFVEPNVGLLLELFTGPSRSCSSELQTGCDLRTLLAAMQPHISFSCRVCRTSDLLPPPLPLLAPPPSVSPGFRPLPPQLHAAVPWRTRTFPSRPANASHSRSNQIRDVDSYRSPCLSESLGYPYLFSRRRVHLHFPDFLAASIGAQSDTQNELIVIGKFIF